MCRAVRGSLPRVPPAQGLKTPAKSADFSYFLLQGIPAARFFSIQRRVVSGIKSSIQKQNERPLLKWMWRTFIGTGAAELNKF